jgi:4-aminobutyrate aminotransferase-like enzyme
VLTLVEEMRHRGILLNKIGPGGGTLKIRPPMPFSRENADLLADTLAEALAGMPE